MARRRYVSTTISQDTRVNKLAIQYGDFAALLYTWMIPHAADDATLPGDPEELLYQVLPGRRDKTEADVRAALDGMAALGLIVGTDDGRIMFPTTAFYRYQTYIKDRNKHGGEGGAQPPENSADANPSQSEQTDAANQRRSAQNTVSPSFSSSPSSSPPLSHSPSPSERAERASPKRPPVRATLPSANELIEQLSPWAEAHGVRDILADEVDRFRDYCLSGKNGKPVTYADYAAACRKWITNPSYGHTSQSRAPTAQNSQRSNAAVKEERMFGNVLAWTPPERSAR